MLKNSKSKFLYYGLAWIPPPPSPLKKDTMWNRKYRVFIILGSLLSANEKKKKKKETTGNKLILHNYKQNFELQGDDGDMSPVSASPILTL